MTMVFYWALVFIGFMCMVGLTAVATYLLLDVLLPE